MFFRNYPILRLLLPLVLGVCIAYWTSLNIAIPWVLLLMLGCWILSFILNHIKKITTNLWSGVFLQLVFVIAGFELTCLHFRNPDETKMREYCRQPSYFVAKIIEHPVPKAKTYKATALLEQSESGQKLRQKVVLYFAKDSLHHPMYGDMVLMKTKFSEIENKRDTYTFDYKKYMQRKGIFYTAYIPSSQWWKTGESHTGIIKEKAYQIQHYFSGVLASSGITGDEYSIITAILLGNKETLDTGLRANYASAGVGHILCVSGMHVGIIFLILGFLLKPLDCSRNLRMLKALILLLFIWLYACITGLSPSVTRAAAMFSFVTFGSLLHRNTTIFHSLFTSLFILLIINPLWLFDIGFQLSYVAVFGIVIFQTKLAALWSPANKILSYFWNLTTVSVAAQLATFPLTVYTFGLFPNYFLLGNLLVITLSFVIVISGVCLLVVSFIPYLSTVVAQLLTLEIKLMNLLTQSIGELPGAVTENISLSWLQMLLIYLCITFFFLLIQQRKRVYYWLGLTTILVLVLLPNI